MRQFQIHLYERQHQVDELKCQVNELKSQVDSKDEAIKIASLTKEPELVQSKKSESFLPCSFPNENENPKIDFGMKFAPEKKPIKRPPLSDLTQAPNFLVNTQRVNRLQNGFKLF
jgi:hypothetical protein